MKMKKLLAASIAAAALTASSAIGAGHDGKVKCKVVNNKGEGVIKEHMAACDTKTHKCNGLNKAGDAESWIWVPSQEICDKINHGNLKGVPKDVTAKLDLSKINQMSDEMRKEVEAHSKEIHKMMDNHGHGMKDKMKDKMKDHGHDMKDKMTDHMKDKMKEHSH